MTATTWPLGIALTSWDYMWRSTPMHRSELEEPAEDGDQSLLSLPEGVSGDELQPQERGYGPLFHRRYRTRIDDPKLSPEELISSLERNLNRAAPTTFARFQKVSGDKEHFAVGDEYVVRMPGPWDGPVRVAACTPRSFRLATLQGHLEAGQIEFRAAHVEEARLWFEIESWARSSNRFSNLLYHHLRMAKEVQAHMWISFLERVVKLSGGRMTGGIEMDTRRLTGAPSAG
ncbi:MAG TPA: DUF1990 family protein [Solirubrobacteraceae bacterium]|jgi:hypothetical protein